MPRKTSYIDTNRTIGGGVIINTDIGGNVGALVRDKTIFDVAKTGFSIKGAWVVGDFASVAAISEEAVILVDLVFYLERGFIPSIKGSIKTELKLECQRCMQTFDFAVICQTAIVFLDNEQQGEGLAGNFEQILLTKKEIFIRDIISDEILLALPMSPKHKNNCLAKNGAMKLNPDILSNKLFKNLKKTKE